jgi:hypothetical protein
MNIRRRGLPVLDIREIMPMFTKIGIHNALDTYDQVSADSIQQTGRAIEQLIRQGDVVGAFTGTDGLAACNGTGILPHWRYLAGGACILAALALPLLFRLRSITRGGRPAQTLIALTLLTGVLTALSALWSGGISFVLLPVLGTIVFLVLQAIVLRRAKSPDSTLGRLLVAATLLFLFAGTWFLTGLWPLGLWMAEVAYLPAVLVTWKPGWGWRILDIALLLPSLLLAWLVAVVVWISAPTHLFPSAKLSFFSALYTAVALVGIWGIFGRRPARRARGADASTILGAS